MPLEIAEAINAATQHHSQQQLGNKSTQQRNHCSMSLSESSGGTGSYCHRLSTQTPIWLYNRAFKYERTHQPASDRGQKRLQIKEKKKKPLSIVT